MKNILVCVFLFSIFISKAQSRDVIFTNQAPKPIGPYSQAILVNGNIFVSGQIALKPDGALDTTSIENEVKQIMSNIEAILKEAKSDFCRINKVTIYTTDLKQFSKINNTYKMYFQNCSPPARETVQVCALPKGARIEVSVVAY